MRMSSIYNKVKNNFKFQKINPLPKLATQKI